MKSNVKTDKNGNIEKITIKLNNKPNCVRCGASKNSDKYISCANEYCDTEPFYPF